MSGSVPIRRMLLGLGGTLFSRAAVDCAVDLAARYDASVTAVPLLDLNSWKQMFGGVASAQQAARALEDQPWRRAQQQLEQIIDRFESRCRERSVRARVAEADPDDPLKTLIERWRYHDLLVFGLRGLFDYWIVPDAGAAITRLVQAGVRPIIAPPAPYRSVRQVLVVFDGSMAAARALKRFAKLNPWPDATVTLSVQGGDDAPTRTLLSDAVAYCQDHGLDPATRTHAGGGAAGLLQLAQQCQADAIVLGDNFRLLSMRDLTGQGVVELIRRSDRLLFISH